MNCLIALRISIHVLAYMVAKVPVSSEWKMMMVSSKSQMKTRSTVDSGEGSGLALFRRVFELPLAFERFFEALRAGKARRSMKRHAYKRQMTELLRLLFKSTGRPAFFLVFFCRTGAHLAKHISLAEVRHYESLTDLTTQ